MDSPKHLTVYDSDYWRRNALFTIAEEQWLKSVIPGRTWDEATAYINAELEKHLTSRQVQNWGRRHGVYAAEIITPEAEPVVDSVREHRQQIKASSQALERLNGAVSKRRLRGVRYG